MKKKCIKSFGYFEHYADLFANGNYLVVDLKFKLKSS